MLSVCPQLADTVGQDTHIADFEPGHSEKLLLVVEDWNGSGELSEGLLVVVEEPARFAFEEPDPNQVRDKANTNNHSSHCTSYCASITIRYVGSETLLCTS